VTELVVLKLGGSVITDKNRPFTYREDVVARIGREIVRCWPTPLLIIHGGGSFGHPIARQYSIAQGYRELRQLEGFVKTLQAMRDLNHRVVQTLVDTGIGAVGMPASLLFVTRNGVIETALLDTLFSALDVGVIPVTCGDAVFDRERKFTVLSGDRIAVYLAKRLHAKRLVFAVDVDGIYDYNRQTGEKHILPELDQRRHASIIYHQVDDVTGGMFEKVDEAFGAAAAGVEVLFVNGLVEGRVEAAVKSGKVVGTRLIGGG